MPGVNAIAKDTVIAVGGLGTQADRAENNGGGATKTAWDSGAPTDFIDTNGGPKSADTAIAYDHAGGTPDRKFSKAGIGTGVTVGTLAYVSGTNITTGIYEITSIAGDDSWVACADITATGDNADSVLNIGGAINNLQNALDGQDGASQNRYIYTNLAETLTVAINVDIYTGSVDTRIIIKGANSSIVVDGTRPVITGNASVADGLLSFTNAADYTQWWHIDFNAGGVNKFDYCIYNPATEISSTYHVFYDCIIRGAVDATGIFIESLSWRVINCQIYDNGDGLWSDGAFTAIIGCSIHDNTGEGIKLSSGAACINNLVYDNGANGIKLADSGAASGIYYGNTVFGNNTHGFNIVNIADRNVLINNTSCGNGTGGSGYGYNMTDRANTLFFAYNHSRDGGGDANDNASGHCNLMSDPTSNSEFADFLEGNNKSGDPKFAGIGDGSEDFTPTAGSALIDNALDAGTA